jgi:hypothetical protein
MPFICNGFKDEEFIETVLLAAKMGRNIYPVAEQMHELELIARSARSHQVTPRFGIRAKLASEGIGRWAESGGVRGKFGLSVSAASDVTGNSDGTQVKGTAFYDNRVGNWFYRGSAGVIWNNEDYIDYYYGVQNDEVDLNLGRTAYEGDDETWVRLGLVLGYQRPESKWMFLVGGRYDIMGDEVDDSPITSDDKMLMGFAGFGYSFGK